MELRLPRDFESFNSFRKLKQLLGNEKDAYYVFFKLWVELGYQAEVHGGSGVFASREAETFMGSLKECADPAAALAALKKSVLTPSNDEGNDWECPMFSYLNPEIDKGYVPHGSKTALVMAFSRRIKAIDGIAPKIMEFLLPECWLTEDGVRIDKETMQRAVVLIKTMDNLLRLPERPGEQFEVGVVSDARRVIQTYSQDKIAVILKRLYFVRSAPTFTRTTEYYLQNFDRLVVKIMPDDGYVSWAKEKGFTP